MTVTADEFCGIISCSINTGKMQGGGLAAAMANYMYVDIYAVVIYLWFSMGGDAFSAWLLCILEF